MGHLPGEARAPWPTGDAPLIAEIRAVRREIAKGLGNDLTRHYQELLKVQEREKHRTVPAPAEHGDRASKAG